MDDLLEEVYTKVGPILDDSTVPRHVYKDLLEALITDLQVRRAAVLFEMEEA